MMNKPVFKRILSAIIVTVIVVCALPASVFAGGVSNVISAGTVTLKGTYLFNCETGAVGNVGDIWWEQVSSTVRRVSPVSPAKVVNLGVVDFDSLQPTKMDDYTYSSTPITGNIDSTNKLVKGDVFLVKTKLGHYTKVKVVTYGNNLAIQWVTYQAPLATPAAVSPANNTVLRNFPRVTTVNWKPVAGATYYSLETQYYSTSWVAYKNVTVQGNLNTSYTFTFVGDQPCRWRVTAYSPNSLSAASAWATFTYDTLPKLVTPVPVSPANNITLYNYPRTTTLTWAPVPGATSYLLEKQYYSAGKWSSLGNVTVNGVYNTSNTFTFVGAQPGRWRVTAIGGTAFRNSPPCQWQNFTYMN